MRLVEGDVDVCPAAVRAGGLTTADRFQHADDAEHRRGVVHDRDTREHRRTVREAGDVGQPGECRGRELVGGLFGVGPALTPPGHAEVHQTGVDRGQVRVAEPPARHGARAHVLDQDVRPADQPAQHRLPLRAPQVERDRTLVAPVHLPVPGVAGLAVPDRTDEITPARGLDLDHLGAEVTEDRRGERTADQCPDVEHLQTVRVGADRTEAAVVPLLLHCRSSGLRLIKDTLHCDPGLCQETRSPGAARQPVPSRPRGPPEDDWRCSTGLRGASAQRITEERPSQ